MSVSRPFWYLVGWACEVRLGKLGRLPQRRLAVGVPFTRAMTTNDSDLCARVVVENVRSTREAVFEDLHWPDLANDAQLFTGAACCRTAARCATEFRSRHNPQIHEGFCPNASARRSMSFTRTHADRCDLGLPATA